MAQTRIAVIGGSGIYDIDGLEVPTLERICLWVAADLKTGLPGLTKVAISRPSLNERCELVL